MRVPSKEVRGPVGLQIFSAVSFGIAGRHESHWSGPERAFDCALALSWALFGVAGDNDLVFYVVGYLVRAEISPGALSPILDD